MLMGKVKRSIQLAEGTDMARAHLQLVDVALRPSVRWLGE
jgi:hypothetical protein